MFSHNQTLFKVMIAIMGILNFLFYVLPTLAAIVNLPESGMDVLYFGAGTVAGLGCFVYLKYKFKILLFCGCIAFLYMVFFLIRVVIAQ
jgi:hypothetical protein